MCDPCIIESVKNRMLSRRTLFKAATAGIATTTLSTFSTNAQAKHHGGYHDLTHTLDEEFPTFSGEPQYSREQVFNYKDNGFNLYNLTLSEHIGTHMDAPIHFSEDANTVDEIPVEDLIAPLCVIDISARAQDDANAQLTPEDINEWTATNGEIPEKACVAMYSGWEHHLGSDKFRNADADGAMHFPGVHIETTQMLLEQTNAIGLAVDTLSLDYGQSADFATHYAWLPAQRWGLENVANLGKLPASGATLIVGAPKFRGGTGGQCRLFAMA